MPRLSRVVGVVLGLSLAPAWAAAPASPCADLLAQLRKTVAPHSPAEATPFEMLGGLPAPVLAPLAADRAAARRSGGDWAELLGRDHAAPPEAVQPLAEMAHPALFRLPQTDLWLFDAPGAPGAPCNQAALLHVPAQGAASRVALPELDGEDCATTRWTPALLAGQPVLIAHQVDRAYPRDRASLWVTEPQGAALAPPCRIDASYSIVYLTDSGYCDGVDCARVRAAAEALMARREAGEADYAEAIGPAAPLAARLRADYARLRALGAAVLASRQVPTFGRHAAAGPLDYQLNGSGAPLPIDLGDGRAYLALFGDEGAGLRETGNYLLAVYGLRRDEAGTELVVPVAGVRLVPHPTAVRLSLAE